MTRKQALNKVIKELSKKKGYEEVVQLLQDICDELPLNRWTDKAIRDSIDQFIIDNGRIPNTNDFHNGNMPTRKVFEDKYRMSIGMWLQENYRAQESSYEGRKEKYTDEFIREYTRIKPKTEREYTLKKANGVMNWQTVARYHNTISWVELIKKLDLQWYGRKLSYDELEEIYTKEFIKEYNRIKPKERNEYDYKKSKNAKSWRTVAKYNGVVGWKNLIEKIGLPIYEKDDYKDEMAKIKGKTTINIDCDFSDDDIFTDM